MEKIPDKAIAFTYNRLKLPKYGEGFNELLFQRGINYNNLPTWQKRGVGVYYIDVLQEGFNPIKNEKVMTKRRDLKVDYELLLDDEYRLFIKDRVD